MAAPAMSAGIASRSAPDPLLNDGPKGPCDPATNSAELAAGTDVNGNPVAPADLDTAKTPVPGQVSVPLARRQGHAPSYVTADGRKLDALVNPPPACPPAH